jgi:hypothetical protein
MRIKSERKKNEEGWNHKKNSILKLSRIKKILIKRIKTKYNKWKKFKEDEIEKKYIIL